MERQASGRWQIGVGRGYRASMHWRSQSKVNTGLRMPARFLALALVAPALAGCESLGSFWGPKNDPVLDEPADRIYNEGLYLLNVKKDTKGAAKRFEEVDRQDPYFEWARKSLIMSAYAYYEAGSYTDSINSARRYIQ